MDFYPHCNLLNFAPRFRKVNELLFFLKLFQV